MLHRGVYFSVLLVVVSLLLRCAAFAGDTAVVDGDLINVRAGSNINSEVILQLNNGDIVELAEGQTDINSFVKIKIPQSGGVWIRSDMLDSAGAVVVKDNVNLRAGSGASHNVVGKINKGEPVHVIQRKGEWVKIKPTAQSYAFVAAQYIIVKKALPDVAVIPPVFAAQTSGSISTSSAPKEPAADLSVEARVPPAPETKDTPVIKEREEAASFLEHGIKDFKAENYEEAVSSLQKAREQDPKSSVAAYYLGLAYKTLQDYEDALIHLKDAVNMEPNVKEAGLELAEAYYLLDMNGESLQQLEAAEKADVKPGHVAFLKGLVLSKLDKDKEAIDAFDMAKNMDTSLAQAANYQIGIALIKQGNAEKAAGAFNEIIIMDPNSDLARFASRYREALTRKAELEKPWKLTLGAGWQYDDNVILKPSDQTVANGISGEKDTAYVALLRAEYAAELSGPLAVKAQYSAYYKDYQTLDAYDVMSHTVAVAPGYALRESMINMLLSYNYTWVDSDKYLNTETVSPGYSLMIGKNQMGQIGLRWQTKDFLKPPLAADENRDSQDLAASLGWFYFYAGNNEFMNINYEINKEDTKGINWKYLGNKLNLNLSIPLKDKLKFNGSAEIYQQQFEHVNTNFLKKRRDRTYTGSALIAYEFYENAEIQFQYTYIRGDSNIAIYDYRKSISNIGIEIRF
ncbi:MAG: SH3 domain-containing protein [Deltaproteobacteria bacterium]|nr:SH3 domain-containing protein [Deltaproteobacteria bacterium]